MTVIAGDLRSLPEQMAAPTIPAPRSMSSSRQPRAIADLTLAATSTAVSVAILFLGYMLRQWDHLELISNGEALMADMVANRTSKNRVFELERVQNCFGCGVSI